MLGLAAGLRLMERKGEFQCFNTLGPATDAYAADPSLSLATT